METQNTVIQNLIEKFQNIANDLDPEKYHSYLCAMNYSIGELRESLPEEKEALKFAHMKGAIFAYGLKEATRTMRECAFAEYFDENYKAYNQ